MNLTNRFRSLNSQTPVFDMIERENMKDILKEQDWMITENCNSAVCAVQVGQLLRAIQISAFPGEKLLVDILREFVTGNE